jgi:hypothetical protein
MLLAMVHHDMYASTATITIIITSTTMTGNDNGGI